LSFTDSWLLLIIPTIWCAISGATLWAMASPEAFIAPLAALATVVCAAAKARRKRSGT
jgi:polyferredoxin